MPGKASKQRRRRRRSKAKRQATRQANQAANVAPADAAQKTQKGQARIKQIELSLDRAIEICNDLGFHMAGSEIVKGTNRIRPAHVESADVLYGRTMVQQKARQAPHNVVDSRRPSQNCHDFESEFPFGILMTQHRFNAHIYQPWYSDEVEYYDAQTIWVAEPNIEWWRQEGCATDANRMIQCLELDKVGFHWNAGYAGWVISDDDFSRYVKRDKDGKKVYQYDIIRRYLQFFYDRVIRSNDL